MNRDHSNYYFLYDFDCVVEDQTELLTVCQEILSSDHIEVSKMYSYSLCAFQNVQTVLYSANPMLQVHKRRNFDIYSITFALQKSTLRAALRKRRREELWRTTRQLMLIRVIRKFNAS